MKVKTGPRSKNGAKNVPYEVYWDKGTWCPKEKYNSVLRGTHDHCSLGSQNLKTDKNHKNYTCTQNAA